LILTWIGLGILCGFLVHISGFGFQRSNLPSQKQILITIGISILGAFIGGLAIGALTESIFSLPHALWVSSLFTIGSTRIIQIFLDQQSLSETTKE
jgi:hypothetical protein